jgi:hypothetical protein
VLPDGRAVWKQQTGNHSRLVLVGEGKDPVPLSGAPDETTFPVTLAGPNQVAFAIGNDRRSIGIASVTTGRIVSRIPFDKGTLDVMLASPDGQSLYCTAAGAIWVQPSAGGTPARLRAGSAVAIDPAGKYLAVVDTYQGRTRLLIVPFDGSNDGNEREIPLGANSRPAPVSSGAINKEGQLLLGLGSPDSWFLEPNIIDLATGHATRVQIDSPGDNFHMAWTPDGEIMASVLSMHGALWKFEPESR